MEIIIRSVIVIILTLHITLNQYIIKAQHYCEDGTHTAVRLHARDAPWKAQRPSPSQYRYKFMS